MICDTLDRRLAGLAKRFGLHYSRYADDITFSSMHYVYAKNGEFRKELIRIIKSQGFTINEEKTRLQKRGSRQEVTGIVVSERKLNVAKKYVREIRSLLYIWEKYGYSVAMSRFLPKYKLEKGHVKKGNPDLINVLEGKLLYLKMV
jgi:retron-type reverse transcriptase